MQEILASKRNRIRTVIINVPRTWFQLDATNRHTVIQLPSFLGVVETRSWIYKSYCTTYKQVPKVLNIDLATTKQQPNHLIQLPPPSLGRFVGRWKGWMMSHKVFLFFFFKFQLYTSRQFCTPLPQGTVINVVQLRIMDPQLCKWITDKATKLAIRHLQ